jgi:CBS domain-containing protein
MLVGEIMKNKGVGVIAVAPDQTMVEVLRLFRDNNIGFVVVSQSNDEYLGSLSERDCCNAVAEYGTEAAMMRVADVMNRNVATCSTRDLLPVAMAIMTQATLSAWSASATWLSTGSTKRSARSRICRITSAGTGIIDTTG